MKITPVPCLQDNYAYVLHRGSSAVVVDPSEARPVQDVLEKHGLQLTEIWLTHHHWDHVGGIEELCETYDVTTVRGSAHDLTAGRIVRQSFGHGDDDIFRALGTEVRVVHVPGHTLGAIAYETEGHLFTGDTLFVAGCGRLFEGTPEMMATSLLKLRALPEATQVWCGHEYAVGNLRFALSVEPNNPAIAERLQQMERHIAQGGFSVPARLGDESTSNPFLRFDLPEVVDGRSPVETFAALRSAKDRF